MLNGARLSDWVITKSDCFCHVVASIESWLQGVGNLIVLGEVWCFVVNTRWLDPMRNGWSAHICSIWASMLVSKVPLAIHWLHLNGLLEVKIWRMHYVVTVNTRHPDPRARLSYIYIGIYSFGLKRVTRFDQFAVLTRAENHSEAILSWLRQKAIVIVERRLLSVAQTVISLLNRTSWDLWYDSLLLLQDHSPVEATTLGLNRVFALEAPLAVVVKHS